MGNFQYPFKLSDYFSFLNASGKELMEKALVKETEDEDELYESFLGIVYRTGYGGWFPYYRSAPAHGAWHGAVDIHINQRESRIQDLAKDQKGQGAAGNLMVHAIADGEIVGSFVDYNYSGPGNGGGFVVAKHQDQNGGDFYVRYGHLHNVAVTDLSDLSDDAWKKLKEEYMKLSSDDKRAAWTNREMNKRPRKAGLKAGDLLTAGQEIAPLGYLTSGDHLHIEVASKSSYAVMTPTLTRAAGDDFTASPSTYGKVHAYVGVTASRLSGRWDDKGNLPGSGWTYYNPVHFIHMLNGGTELKLAPWNKPVKGSGSSKPKPVPHAEGGDVEIPPVLKAKPFQQPEIKKLGAKKSFAHEDLKSAAVLAIQQALVDVNLGETLGTSGKNHDGVDGSYGKLTTKAVEAIQKTYKETVQKFAEIAGVEATEDGKMNWPTLLTLDAAWVAIDKALSRPGGFGGAAKESSDKQASQEPVVQNDKPKEPAGSSSSSSSSGAAASGEWKYPHPGFKAHEIFKSTPKLSKRNHPLEGGVGYSGYLKAELSKDEARGIIAIATGAAEGGKYDSVNMYDRGVLSWGLAQWTVHAGSMQKFFKFIKQKEPAVFDQVFVQQGLDVGQGDLGLKVDGKPIGTLKEIREAFKGTSSYVEPTKNNATPPDSWTDEQREVMRRWVAVFASAAHHETIQKMQEEFHLFKEMDDCLTRDLSTVEVGKDSKYKRFHKRWSGKGYKKATAYVNKQLWAQALYYGLWVNNRILSYAVMADAVDECAGDSSHFGEVLFRVCENQDYISSWREDNQKKPNGRIHVMKKDFDKVVAGRNIEGIDYGS